MKLRLGQPVHATDGPYGEVGDIVVDPHARTVSHLVVQPRHAHQQARLVPMWLISVDGDDIRVALDIAHIRALQRVAYRDFVALGEAIAVDDDWDIGTEDVVALPYSGLDMDLGEGFDSSRLDVGYDRIPKGECEIRRTSQVITSDDQMVGHVEGFVADGDHLMAVVVKSGLSDLHRRVFVPMGKVDSVGNDEIQLSLTKATFADLPKSSLEGPLGDSDLDHLEHVAARVVGQVRRSASRLADRARHAADRDTKAGS